MPSFINQSVSFVFVSANVSSSCFSTEYPLEPRILKRPNGKVIFVGEKYIMIVESVVFTVPLCALLEGGLYSK